MDFKEAKLVENYIVQNLQGNGWTFIPTDELIRESYQEPLLITNLITALKKINKNLDIGDEEVNNMIFSMICHK